MNLPIVHHRFDHCPSKCMDTANCLPAIKRFVGLPKHTKTPEHTGNYQNTLILLVIGNV